MRGIVGLDTGPICLDSCVSCMLAAARLCSMLPRLQATGPHAIASSCACVAAQMGLRAIPVRCLALDGVAAVIQLHMPADPGGTSYETRVEEGKSAANQLNKMLWWLQSTTPALGDNSGPLVGAKSGSMIGGGMPSLPTRKVPAQMPTWQMLSAGMQSRSSGSQHGQCTRAATCEDFSEQNNHGFFSSGHCSGRPARSVGMTESHVLRGASFPHTAGCYKALNDTLFTGNFQGRRVESSHTGLQYHDHKQYSNFMAQQQHSHTHAHCLPRQTMPVPRAFSSSATSGQPPGMPEPGEGATAAAVCAVATTPPVPANFMQQPMGWQLARPGASHGNPAGSDAAAAAAPVLQVITEIAKWSFRIDVFALSVLGASTTKSIFPSALNAPVGPGAKTTH
eukprot:362018-Chlamydomonas_euryale.AAC.10